MIDRTDRIAAELLHRLDVVVAKVDADLPVGYRLLIPSMGNLFGAWLLMLDISVAEAGLDLFLTSKLSGAVVWLASAHYLYVAGQKSDWRPD